MGIKDLTKLIKNEIPEAIETHNLKDINKKITSIAIDISIYINKYVRTAGVNDWLPNFIIMLTTLKSYGFYLVCIFDGMNKPEEKKQEQAERIKSNEKIKDKTTKLEEIYAENFMDNEKLTGSKLQKVSEQVKMLTLSKANEDIDYDDYYALKLHIEEMIDKYSKQCVKISSSVFKEAKEILDILGIPYYTASGEGETEAVKLVKYKVVDAVMTEDTDVLAYSCPFLLRSLDTKLEKIEIIHLDSILKGLNLTQKSFVDMCILLGCDYNSRVRGYGIVKTLASIQEHKSIENMNFTPEQLTQINHIRVRELFKIPRLTDNFKLPLSKKLNEEKLREFIEKKNIKLSPNYIINMIHKSDKKISVKFV